MSSGVWEAVAIGAVVAVVKGFQLLARRRAKRAHIAAFGPDSWQASHGSHHGGFFGGGGGGHHGGGGGHHGGGGGGGGHH